MAITVTILKPNTFDQFGRLMVVGQSYSLPDDLAKGLFSQQSVSDTNGVMSYPYTAPFEFGGVFDTNGVLVGFKSSRGVAAVGAPLGSWANKPLMKSNERGAFFASDVGANVGGAGGGNLFIWTGLRWKPSGGNIILDAVDTPNSATANTVEQNLNPTRIAIPAGVIGLYDRLRVRASFSKSGTTDTCTIRFRFGNTGTVADPVIATVTSLATTQQTDAVFLDFKAMSMTTLQKVGNATTDKSYNGPDTGVYPAAVTVPDMTTNGTFLAITTQMTGGTEVATLQDYTMELYPTDSA